MPPLLVEVPDPSVGRLDTKVNKGRTVTAQPLQSGGFISSPYGSSEQADGLKEGFEEGRKFQEL